MSAPIAITITDAVDNSTAYSTAANYQDVQLNEECEAAMMTVWANSATGSATLRMIWVQDGLIYRVADATVTQQTSPASQTIAGLTMYSYTVSFADTSTNKIDLMPRPTNKPMILRLGSPTIFGTISTLIAYIAGTTKI